MKFLWAIPIFSLAAGSLQEDSSSLLQHARGKQVQDHASSSLQNVLEGPVQSAWNNQAKSFVLEIVEDKLKDYSKDSVINVYNNIGGSLEVYNGIPGARKFFGDVLFPNLCEGCLDFADSVVTEALGAGLSAVPGNVLLVWSSEESGYTQATDTFVFNADSKILRQNVVVSYKDPRPTGARRRRAEVVPTGQGPVHTGWARHWNAFKRQRVEQLLKGYTRKAVITSYNQADRSKYVTYTGSNGIRKFYDSLFATFTANTIDLAAPVQHVEESPPGVFLTWSSPACGYSTGTDTFIFNREGKIVRHTAVVHYIKP